VIQLTEPGTYVVSDPMTGWSDESMRFATLSEAEAWIAASDDPGGYSWRYEE
jgi:hypothetical protein